MSHLPETLFTDPVRHALQTKHRHFALRAGDACRYPADVAPFASVAAPTPETLRQLHSLLAPDDSVWLFGDQYPRVPELAFEGTMGVLQMVLPDDVILPGPAIELTPLAETDGPEMVALTDLAFPGFFRPRTCEMGSYYGVRSESCLIAMGGERMMLDGYSEISGVCTHPAHRGQGLAANLILQLVQNHRRDGLVSWLHVGSGNHPAIELYHRLQFTIAREVTITRISRSVL
jgi:ribosomal protein S18 acetylase RimI-like enzyme